MLRSLRTPRDNSKVTRETGVGARRGGASGVVSDRLDRDYSPRMTTTWMRRAAVGVVLGATAIVSASCTGLGDFSTKACPQLRPDVDALNVSYANDPAVNAKVRAFVQATKDIVGAAAEADRLAAEACMRMGIDLGVPPQAMSPDATARGGQRAKGACDPVATRIAELQAQGIGVSAHISVPQCQADVQAEANCRGGCQASLDPGYVIANCQPGQLSGFCQGTCVGQCDGSCFGQCNGTCTQRDAAGNCAGACQGECRGNCDAVCHAYCEGQWQSPRCDLYARPPSADAQCEASCRASANVRASCTPAQVQVAVNQNTQAAMALVATLQANLPQLIRAQWVLGQRITGDIDALVGIGQQMPQMIGQAGAHALACIAGAADMSVSASISVQVTVQASAGVSGRVSR